MIHALKIEPDALKSIRSGEKRADLRINDRGFKQGDTIALCEWNKTNSQPTGEVQLVQITHIENGGRFGLQENHCVLSLSLLFIDWKAKK